MNDSDSPQNIKRVLKRRLAEFKKVTLTAIEIAETGTKQDVVKFLAEHYDETPIPQEHDVLLGTQLIKFTGDGQFMGIHSVSIPKVVPNSPLGTSGTDRK